MLIAIKHSQYSIKFYIFILNFKNLWRNRKVSNFLLVFMNRIIYYLISLYKIILFESLGSHPLIVSNLNIYFRRIHILLSLIKRIINASIIHLTLFLFLQFWKYFLSFIGVVVYDFHYR